MKSSGNQILMNLVNPACEKLLNRVKFFCVVDREGQIRLPLIGDVSPDFRPNWLISLFHCELWHGELCCDHKVADFKRRAPGIGFCLNTKVYHEIITKMLSNQLN